ncbi:MAG: helix-turn-helix domain-containing protein [Patescibacteria group bacterium]
MKKQEFYSTTEAAKLLGVSRITVFNWIGKRKLVAKKIGRNYIIPARVLAPYLQQQVLSEEAKATIDDAVKRTVKEYGETLKLLANA